MADENRSSDETVTRIAEALLSVRQSAADLSEEQRLDRYRRTLEDEIATLPDAEAEPLLRAVREHLIDEARNREQRFAALETQLQQLRTERDDLVVERERLASENETLRAAPPTSDPGSGADVLAQFQSALRQFTEGKELEDESLGLSDADARLFRMVLALLRFALRFEDAVNVLLMEFQVGPVKDMDTRQARTYMRVIRDRFRACLEGEEGSIEALREILDRNSRFLIELNTAYTRCIYDGSQAMLSALDPQPILAEHKRMMGHNFEEAFHALSRIQGDLSNLTRAELWGQFFSQPFRERFASSSEPDPSRS